MAGSFSTCQKVGFYKYDFTGKSIDAKNLACAYCYSCSIYLQAEAHLYQYLINIYEHFSSCFIFFFLGRGRDIFYCKFKYTCLKTAVI